MGKLYTWVTQNTVSTKTQAALKFPLSAHLLDRSVPQDFSPVYWEKGSSLLG